MIIIMNNKVTNESVRYIKQWRGGGRGGGLTTRKGGNAPAKTGLATPSFYLDRARHVLIVGIVSCAVPIRQHRLNNLFLLCVYKEEAKSLDLT